MEEVILHFIGNIPTFAIVLGLAYITSRRFKELKGLIVKYQDSIEECCRENL